VIAPGNDRQFIFEQHFCGKVRPASNIPGGADDQVQVAIAQGCFQNCVGTLTGRDLELRMNFKHTVDGAWRQHGAGIGQGADNHRTPGNTVTAAQFIDAVANQGEGQFRVVRKDIAEYRAGWSGTGVLEQWQIEQGYLKPWRGSIVTWR
jgi:hypothetical protein